MNTETVYIIRFANGNFLSLLDAETPKDFEAMVFDSREKAVKSCDKIPEHYRAAVVSAELDEHKCPFYTERKDNE